MKIYEKLATIQSLIHAPKEQTNASMRFKYRSAEDIVEAAKPALKATGCALTMRDEIEYIEGRFYLKATATLSDGDGESVSVSAYAREADEKRPLDPSQVTGSASSYARKYALGGLFAVDGGEDDPDATATAKKGDGAQAHTKPVTAQNAKSVQVTEKRDNAPSRASTGLTGDDINERTPMTYERACKLTYTVTKGGKTQTHELGKLTDEQLAWVGEKTKGDPLYKTAVDIIFEHRMDEEGNGYDGE